MALQLSKESVRLFKSNPILPSPKESKDISIALAVNELLLINHVKKVIEFTKWKKLGVQLTLRRCYWAWWRLRSAEKSFLISLLIKTFCCSPLLSLKRKFPLYDVQGKNQFSSYRCFYWNLLILTADIPHHPKVEISYEVFSKRKWCKVKVIPFWKFVTSLPFSNCFYQRKYIQRRFSLLWKKKPLLY